VLHLIHHQLILVKNYICPQENVVVVPGTVKLIFNLNVPGHTSNRFVNNVGRALVTEMKVIYGGAVVQDTKRYDLIKLYENFI